MNNSGSSPSAIGRAWVRVTETKVTVNASASNAGNARFFKCITLEDVLERELHLATVGRGRADRAEPGRAERRIREAEIHPVEQVERLGANLQPMIREQREIAHR